ncbi:DNA-protecting protein DprA [Collinsella sp. An2]|uniref:DNA-processing protein DprA n=1 Tax=Collinsella sp. An2 TaxID=1965585 RepID=UPI000B39D58D|nr:DNA-protecting protein DprA [Collinsella sp. An2]OUP08232.1 DNA processing protein DprA [Collinsella sp. An2]
MTAAYGHGDRWVIERDSEDYPSCVRELSDAPQRIYGRGDPTLLGRPALAIIGSRVATPYGIAASQMAARFAVEADVLVVSGGAIGCDQAGGLESLERGGKHVIVLGCGADVVYPRASAALFERTLAAGGAIISLDPWGTEPRRWAFPRRNRVIAALSLATFIGEAGLPSGTFSTAETALELGREVLAVPGSIFSAQSRGTNYLISEGACCIADEASLDVAISRIFGTLRRTAAHTGAVPTRDPAERAVLEALTASPLRSEDIARVAKLDTFSGLQLIGSLVVKGLVVQLPDGRYGASETTLHAQTSFGHNVSNQTKR